MKKGLALVISSLLLLAFGPGREARAAEDWAARQARESASQARFEAEQAKLPPLKEKLTGTPRESWAQEDIDAYLAQLLRTLNAYLVNRMSGYIDAPWSLDQVILKHDKPWEFAYNPLRVDAEGNWLPVRGVAPGGPFSPGDLVYQYCPAERFSLFDGWPRAGSYELSINGSTPQCAGLAGQAAAVTPGNAGWAIVPRGTLLQLGRYEPPMDPGARLPRGEKSALEYAQDECRRRELGIAYFDAHLTDIPHGSNYRPYWAVRSVGSLRVMEEEIANLEAALRAKPREAWTEGEVNSYLQTALWLAYLPCRIAGDLSPIGASNFDDLLTLKIMPAMPPNPLRNWEPLRVLRPEDGFSAGDICLQTAPPAFMHDVNAPFWDNSLVLGIYGPSEDETLAAPSQLGRHNADWAVRPAGLLMALGTYTEHSAYSEFERVVAWDGVSEERMQREDGTRRRIPQSLASRRLPAAEIKLRALAPEQQAAGTERYLRQVALSVFGAADLYKYEHGALPADPLALVGDYLDAWPGDPLHPNPDGSWPPLRVALREADLAPGALLWQPGYASPARWVQAGLRGQGGAGDPARAYRLSIYGCDAQAPLLVIDAPAETQVEILARATGRLPRNIEQAFTRRAPARSIWPAGYRQAYDSLDRQLALH